MLSIIIQGFDIEGEERFLACYIQHHKKRLAIVAFLFLFVSAKRERVDALAFLGCLVAFLLCNNVKREEKRNLVKA